MEDNDDDGAFLIANSPWRICDRDGNTLRIKTESGKSAALVFTDEDLARGFADKHGDPALNPKPIGGNEATYVAWLAAEMDGGTTHLVFDHVAGKPFRLKPISNLYDEAKRQVDDERRKRLDL